MNSTELYSLLPGESATVEELEVGSDLQRRLLDLGLTKGAAVTCVGQSPFGDPLAYRVRGAVIAIRCADSKRIRVSRRWD